MALDLQQMMDRDPQFRAYFVQRMGEISQSSGLKNNTALLQSMVPEIVSEYYAPDKTSTIRAERPMARKATSARITYSSADDIHAKQGEATLASVLHSYGFGYADMASFGLLPWAGRKMGIPEPEIDTGIEKFAAGAGAMSAFALPGLPGWLGGAQVGVKGVTTGLRALAKTKGGQLAVKKVLSKAEREAMETTAKIGVRAIDKNTDAAAIKILESTGVKAEDKITRELGEIIGQQSEYIVQNKDAIAFFKWQKPKGLSSRLKDMEVGSKEFFQASMDEIMDKTVSQSRGQVLKIIEGALGKPLSDTEGKAMIALLRQELTEGTMTTLEKQFAGRFGRLAGKAVRSAAETGLEFGVFSTAHATVHGLTVMDWEDPDAFHGFLDSVKDQGLHGFQAGLALGGVVKMIPNLFWASKHGAIQDIKSSHGLGKITAKGDAEATAGVIRGIYEELAEKAYMLDPQFAGILDKLKIGSTNFFRIPTYGRALKKLKGWAENPEKLTKNEQKGLRQFGGINSRLLKQAGRAEEASVLEAAIGAGDTAQVARLIHDGWRGAIRAFRGEAYKGFVKQAIATSPRILAAAVSEDPGFFGAVLAGRPGEYMEDHGLTWGDVAASLGFATMLAQHSIFAEPVAPQRVPGPLDPIHANKVLAASAGVPVYHMKDPSFAVIQAENLGEQYSAVTKEIWNRNPKLAEELGDLQDQVRAGIANVDPQGEGPTDPFFARQAKGWLRRLNIEEQDLTPAQLGAMEKIIHHELPWDMLSMSRFDDWYFGEDLQRLGQHYGEMRDDLIDIVMNKNGKPLRFLAGEDVATEAQLDAIERLARVGQALSPAQQATEVELKSPQEVTDVLEVMKTVEARVQAVLGENFGLEALPGLRSFTNINPRGQIFDILAGRHNLKFEPGNPLSEVGSYFEEVRKSWRKGQVEALVGDDPVSLSTQMVAKVTQAAEGLPIKEVSGTDAQRSLLKTRLEGMSREAQDLIRGAHGEVMARAEELAVGGDVTRPARELLVYAEIADLISLDGTMRANLVEAAVEHDRESGRKILAPIITGLVDRGRLKVPEKGYDADPMLFQKAKNLVFNPVVGVFDADLAYAGRSKFQTMALQSGLDVDSVHELGELLVHPHEGVKSWIHSELTKDGFILRDVANPGKVIIPKEITGEMIVQRVKDLQGEMETDGFLKRIESQYGDSESYERDFHIKAWNFEEASSFTDFFEKVDLPSQLRWEVVGEINRQALAAKRRALELPGNTRGVVEPSAIREIISRSLTKTGAISDPDWIRAVDDHYGLGIGPVPEIREGIHQGKWSGDVISDRTIEALAFKLSGSEFGRVFSVSAVDIKAKDGKAYRRPTHSSVQRFIPKGPSGFYDAIKRAGGEIGEILDLSVLQEKPNEDGRVRNYFEKPEDITKMGLAKKLVHNMTSYIINPGGANTNLVASFKTGQEATGVQKLVSNMFGGEPGAGRRERFLNSSHGDPLRKLIDGKVVGEGEVGDALSRAWLASRMPDTQLKQFLKDPQMQGTTLSRLKTVYARNFYEVDAPAGSTMHKKLVASEFAKRKLKEDPGWTGEIGTYFLDTATIEKISTELGFNRSYADGFHISRLDLIEALADVSSQTRGASGKIQIGVADPSRGVFYQDKPALHGNIETEKLLDWLSEKAGRPVDMIILKDSVKIHPDGVKWAELPERLLKLPPEDAIAELHEGAIREGFDPEALRHDILEFGDFSVHKIDSGVMPGAESYAGEGMVSGKMLDKYYQLREGVPEDLFSPTGPMAMLMRGAVDPRQIGEILGEHLSGRLEADGTINHGQRSFAVEYAEETGLSPTTIMGARPVYEAVAKKVRDEFIKHQSKGRSFGSHVFDTTRSSLRRGQVIPPMSVGQRGLRKYTKMRVGPGASIVYGRLPSSDPTAVSDFNPATRQITIDVEKLEQLYFDNLGKGGTKESIEEFADRILGADRDLESVNRGMKNSMRLVGESVIEQHPELAGDIRGAVDFYSKKYGLGQIRIIRTEGLEDAQNTQAKIISSTKQDGTDRQTDLHIDAKLAKEDPTLILGAVRHEIEHLRDTLESGHKPRELDVGGVANLLRQGANPGKLLREAKKGHHAKLDYFEIDYLYNQRQSQLAPNQVQGETPVRTHETTPELSKARQWLLAPGDTVAYVDWRGAIETALWRRKEAGISISKTDLDLAASAAKKLGKADTKASDLTQAEKELIMMQPELIGKGREEIFSIIYGNLQRISPDIAGFQKLHHAQALVQQSKAPMADRPVENYEAAVKALLGVARGHLDSVTIPVFPELEGRNLKPNQVQVEIYNRKVVFDSVDAMIDYAMAHEISHLKVAPEGLPEGAELKIIEKKPDPTEAEAELLEEARIEDSVGGGPGAWLYGGPVDVSTVAFEILHESPTLSRPDRVLLSRMVQSSRWKDIESIIVARDEVRPSERGLGSDVMPGVSIPATAPEGVAIHEILHAYLRPRLPEFLTELRRLDSGKHTDRELVEILVDASTSEGAERLKGVDPELVAKTKSLVDSALTPLRGYESISNYEQRIEALMKEDPRKSFRDYDPADPSFWVEVIRKSVLSEELGDMANPIAGRIARFFGSGKSAIDWNFGDTRLNQLIGGLEGNEGVNLNTLVETVRELTVGRLGPKINKSAAERWYNNNFEGLTWSVHSMPRLGNYDRRFVSVKEFASDPRVAYTEMRYEDMALLQRDNDWDTLYFHHDMPGDLLRDIEMSSRRGVGADVRNADFGDGSNKYNSVVEYNGVQRRYGKYVGAAANLTRDITWFAQHSPSLQSVVTNEVTGREGGRYQYGGVFDNVKTSQQLVSVLRGEPIEIKLRLDNGTEKTVWYRALLENGMSIHDAQNLNVTAFTDSKKYRLKEIWDNPEMLWREEIWKALLPQFDLSTGELLPAAAGKQRRQDFVDFLQHHYGFVARSVQQDALYGRDAGLAKPGESVRQPFLRQTVGYHRMQDLAQVLHSTIPETVRGDVEIDRVPVFQKDFIGLGDVRIERPIALGKDSKGHSALQNATVSEQMVHEYGQMADKVFSMRQEDIPLRKAWTKRSPYPTIREIYADAEARGVDPIEEIDRYFEHVMDAAEAASLSRPFVGGRPAALEQLAFLDWIDTKFKTSYDVLAGEDPGVAYHIWKRASDRMIMLYDLNNALTSHAVDGTLKIRNQMLLSALTARKFPGIGGRHSEIPPDIDLRNMTINPSRRRWVTDDSGKRRKIPTEWTLDGVDADMIRRLSNYISEKLFDPDSFMPSEDIRRIHGLSGDVEYQWQAWEKGLGGDPSTSRVPSELRRESYDAMAALLLKITGGMTPPAGNPVDKLFQRLPRHISDNGRWAYYNLPLRSIPSSLFENMELRKAFVRIGRELAASNGSDIAGTPESFSFVMPSQEIVQVSRSALKNFDAGTTLWALGHGGSTEGLHYVEDFGGEGGKRLRSMLESHIVEKGKRPDYFSRLVLEIQNEVLKKKIAEGRLPQENRYPEKMILTKKDFDSSRYCL